MGPIDYKSMAQMLMMQPQMAGGPQGEVKPKPMINWALRMQNAIQYGGDEDIKKVLQDAQKHGIDPKALLPSGF